MADEPTDADIEARLRAVPAERWEALWAAVDAFDRSVPHVRWEPPRLVGTREVDGEEREVHSLGYPVYDDAVAAVLRGLGGVGAVVPFDWGAWAAWERYPGGQGLDQAPVAHAVRVITTVLRGERFSEGTIEAALDDGTLLAAVDRLRSWWSAELR